MSETDALLRALERARRELLDLTTRTRLLDTPRGPRPKTIEIVDELSDEVFRILVDGGRRMTFLPRKEPAAAEDPTDEWDPAWSLLPQPDEEELDDRGIASRHRDTRLQTKMDSVRLQKRLLQLYRDARSFQEEQGISVLYLAIGMLQWFEAPSSDRARHAPLILLPVTLERTDAQSQFRISFAEEELATNLSLQAKLKQDFGVELPDLPEIEDLRPSNYLNEVAQSVAGRPRWQVLTDDMILGFFSFAKFLMYRDLDPTNWPPAKALEEHPLIRGLLVDGFEGADPAFPEETDVDSVIDPLDQTHVVDADSSQALALLEAAAGRNLVIQGPPGTGKSQTITNLIAAALKEGKRTLFVAEKRAALEVVKRRLDTIHLGDACLELHSHKARKKTVLDELQRTLRLGRPKGEAIEPVARKLSERRDRLNAHVRAIHTPLEPSGFSPFQIVGQLVRLRADGIGAQEFDLEGPLEWSRQDLEKRREETSRLARHVERIGVPAEHPWRGVGLSAVLPTDTERITQKARVLAERIEQQLQRLFELARPMEVRVEFWGDVAPVLAIARVVLAAPELDPTGMSSSVWEDQVDRITELVANGQEYAEVRSKLSGRLLEAAWEHDLSFTRMKLSAHGRSLFRILNAEYRAAKTEYQQFAVGRPPSGLDQRLEQLDSLAKGQALRAALREEGAMGVAAFGSLWRGEDTDWDQVRAVVKWEADARSAGIPGTFRAAVERAPDKETLAAQIEGVERADSPLREELADLFTMTKLDLNQAFGGELAQARIEHVGRRLGQWARTGDGVQEWISCRLWSDALRSLGLSVIVDRLHSGQLVAGAAGDSLNAAFFEALMRHVFEKDPELAAFQGRNHEETIRTFRNLDEQRIELARLEVAAAHHDGLPSGVGGKGEMGLLQNEFRKKRRHLPLRQLMDRAGAAIQRIKPVFMMSPMSVAQYLKPGVLDFDLLIFDEASQVRPVEALGAVARSKQVVVVGDDKQLPPTRFFDKISEGEEPEDEGEYVAGDLESILGMCLARGIPDRMLLWHYRSRHESLIAVSNKEFYENRLFVVPNPGNESRLGVHFNFVEGGVFDRGGSATNRVEARTVARAVMSHARTRPTVTLGVGAFSVSQRDAILDELEILRRDHPETEMFFGSSGAEPFFVKNLESIQGDERDVIFISVGYAKDRSGYMAMSFGPIAVEGGERRLNVLISRARRRCEVFSSITAADIDLARARSRGAAVLRTYLQYAESGILDVPQISGRDPDSPFEEEVARALQGLGYDVVHQIGIAGFYIDLAVRDPDRPGAFVLGVECDGATYHSSRSARDRDRLRQKVLEDRGWSIHRIWSTDWFHRPEDELRRVVAAIEAARNPDPPEDEEQLVTPDLEASEPAEDSSIPASPFIRVGGGEAEQAPEPNVRPYQCASFQVNSNYEPHVAPLRQLEDAVTRIVQVEGPIHGEEIGRRLATVWGKGRAGSRIQDAASRGLKAAVRKGLLAKDGEFYTTSVTEECPPRSRADVECDTVRKPEMLPPVEIRSALRDAVEHSVGISPDEAIVLATRLFGFDRAGQGLKSVIERQMRKMLGDEILRLREGKLYVG